VIPTFIRAYEASAAVTGFGIAAFSDAASTDRVALAGANTAPIIGVFDRQGADIGGMADVIRAGLAPVLLGGTVTAGAPLTSNADGAAIAAVAATATTVRIIGYADAPGVVGDIIDVWVAPGLLHSAA